MSPDAGAARGARDRALRVAFAISLGLLAEVWRGAPLPPLAPVIALQLLVLPGRPPGLRMSLALLGLVAGAAGLAWLVSSLTARSPFLEAIGIGLLYLWGFALAFRPKQEMAGVMVITMTVVVTSLSGVSTELSAHLILELMASAGIGLVLVWLAHAAIGGAPQATPGAGGSGAGMPGDAGARAVLAALVLLPAHMWLNAGGVASMVILLTAAAVLRQPDPARSARFGLAFAGGNALGGALAAATAGLLALHPGPLSLVTLTAACALILVTIATALRRGPELMLPALTGFTLLTGLALSPLPQGVGVAWERRVLDIVVAAVYALAAVSVLAPLLLRPRRTGAAPPDRTRPRCGR